jgi:hypothetical protein
VRVGGGVVDNALSCGVDQIACATLDYALYGSLDRSVANPTVNLHGNTHLGQSVDVTGIYIH